VVALFALMCGPAWAQTAAEPIKTHVTANGLVADLYVPAEAKGRLPAVIVLGGSEGGLGVAAARDARLLALHGYVTLHVAYFDAPGLPKDLGLIPLEYFRTATDWLAARPDVDPKRIGLEGGSIGSEVALTVAAHDPRIKVVVATMPSGIVWPGISHTATPAGSTFTLDGKPLPYLPYGTPFTSVYDLYAKGLAALDQHPDAVIPVERIAGPVMLVCGKADTLWPSCPMAEQVVARLKAKGFKPPVQFLEYDGAGHAVFGGSWTPDEATGAAWIKLGGTVEGNRAARQDSWPRSVAFLDRVLQAGRR
jgi:dienelactone hydrolase